MIHDMSINLTNQEFADALGMKKNDIFVKKMFNIVDKEKSGKITFQNFLDTVVLFTKGTSEDKKALEPWNRNIRLSTKDFPIFKDPIYHNKFK